MTRFSRTNTRSKQAMDTPLLAFVDADIISGQDEIAREQLLNKHMSVR